MRMLNSPNYIEVKPVQEKKLKLAGILNPQYKDDFPTLSKYCAIDCEMDESDGQSVVIKVTLVNETGEILLDTFVNPETKITKSLYDVHGIQEIDYRVLGVPLQEIQKVLITLLFRGSGD